MMNEDDQFCMCGNTLEECPSCNPIITPRKLIIPYDRERMLEVAKRLGMLNDE